MAELGEEALEPCMRFQTVLGNIKEKRINVTKVQINDRDTLEIVGSILFCRDNGS